MTIALISLVALAALGIGMFSVRVVRSTGDFLVAARSVSPALNGASIAGEYLSLASFLGVAGLVLGSGVGVLWFPVGFTAGYLVLLVAVAAPLRRSGAYTVPDFVENRLGSPPARRLAGMAVLLIGWTYLVPQFQGAGRILERFGGVPYPLAVLLAGTLVAVTVALGGMRSATYVQAFHYAVKLFFLAVPALVLIVAVGPAGRSAAVHPERGTRFPQATTVEFHVPAVLQVRSPVTVTVDDRTAAWAPGRHPVSDGTRVRFPRGAPVPQVRGTEELGGPAWRTPLLHLPGSTHPLFQTWSLLLATVLGTVGLPHILVRLHTSSDGRAARRAVVVTLALLGLFYLAPAVYGLLGRTVVPQLYLTGPTDTVALVLPGAVLGPPWGAALSAVVAAGTYAAFLATSSGLLLVVAGGIGHDLRTGSLRDLRMTVVLGAAVGVLLALPARSLEIGVVVGWAFAISASTLCPLLLLGIWWRGLTAAGAGAGLVVGGVSAAGAAAISALGAAPAGWPRTLCLQPAAWSVPLACTVMVAVSRLGRPPAGAEDLMLAMHVPESAEPVRRGR
ncbi:cation acetate symporter [Streptomyces filipinensis]|uniref:Cation acetate symporter n=1 Tax=Streptomyces filipinensis TaxID=66887 RepID=A0A918IA22_9ACTN|nr:cation acetate symporter [Streptomyces filipinensis]GGU93284.1 cation acetate symporter [Streptomyces filipinensis]